MVIEVALYGSLRRYGDAGVVAVEVSDSPQVREVRAALRMELEQRGAPGSLVDSAACSDGVRILSDDDSIADSSVVALLPPVCGG